MPSRLDINITQDGAGNVKIEGDQHAINGLHALLGRARSDGISAKRRKGGGDIIVSVREERPPAKREGGTQDG